MTLVNLKLNTWKLDENCVDLNAIASDDYLKLSKHSFNTQNINTISPYHVIYLGKLYNYNTIEGLQKLDKSSFFRAFVNKQYQNLCNWKLENEFFILSYADLKKYKFMFWLCIPALHLPNQARIVSVSAFSVSSKDLLRYNYDFFVIRENNEVSDYSTLKNESSWNCDWKIGFKDPTSDPKCPGWPLRNYLVLLKIHFDIQQVYVVCLRESQSLLCQIELDGPRISESPKASGWEKNSHGKLFFKQFDLGSTMDSLTLANSTVDLNLKLMKWRQVPSLDLNSISSAKTLILGAGTLGCYVARALIGWGVKTITFVDNSSVSASNLVRQPLFKFDDIGKQKALAAAENLKSILPSLNVLGVFLNILMPDHPENEKSALSDFETLVHLFRSHDVIFLVTDSREARWLPTVLGVTEEKLVINIALGFDSYMVMRHGVSSEDNSLNVGCYFCNDVIAPQNSFKDRTLDQQCTVTRPGLAGIASSYGVELMASILQHPLKQAAPAHNKSMNAESQSTLGLLPHQIRGFLSEFSTNIISGVSYDKCIACSPTIISRFKDEGFKFVANVLQNSDILEEITGLKQMKLQTDLLDLEVSDLED